MIEEQKARWVGKGDGRGAKVSRIPTLGRALASSSGSKTCFDHITATIGVLPYLARENNVGVIDIFSL